MQKETTIPASEFARNFGSYRDRATGGEVVRVTSHGRTVGAYLSAKEYERYKRLKRRERQILKVGALPDDIVADIENARYGKTPT